MHVSLAAASESRNVESNLEGFRCAQHPTAPFLRAHARSNGLLTYDDGSDALETVR